MPLTTDHMCYFRWLSVLKGLLAVPNSHKPSGTFIHRCIAKKCDFPGYLCCFPSCSLLVLSFAGCGQLLRLASCRLVSYPQSLPPLVVRLAWDRVVHNLWNWGRSCWKKLPEGVYKKISRRGVDDQPCCWKGHRGCLTTKNGHQTRKMHFSVEFLVCVFNFAPTVVAFLGIA